jgi:N-acetylneuraminate synthase
LAKKIIFQAKKNGADAVKFQTFTKESLFSSVVFKNNKKLRNEVFKYALDFDQFYEIKKYCDSLDITFSATPFSKSEVDFLVKDLNVCFVKIASMDLNNYPFIDYIAKFNIPIILSTGFSTIKEISKALNIIKKNNNKNIILMHCVGEYPPKDEIINLPKIKFLQNKFSCRVGFSDHSLGIPISLAAISLGARVIEKHFTINKKLVGWDHSISLDPRELNLLVKESRRIILAIQNKGVKVVEKKKKINFFRRSIVASRLINKGEKINHDMLDYKRPGTGLSPENSKKVIGKFASKNIKKDDLVHSEDIY